MVAVHETAPLAAMRVRALAVVALALVLGACTIAPTRSGHAVPAGDEASAANPAPPAGDEASPTHPLTPEESVDTLNSTRVQISPDGKWLLVVARDQVPDANPEAPDPQAFHVYLKEARPGGESQSLPPSAAEAVWEPDSHGLTVLQSKGDDCTQLWRIPLATREPVLQSEGCLQPQRSAFKRPQWSKDGRYFAVLVQPRIKDEVDVYSKRVTAGPVEQPHPQHCLDPASPEGRAMGLDALDWSCEGISVGTGWMIGLQVATPSLRFFWMKHSLPPPTELWVWDAATAAMRRVSEAGQDVRRYDWSFSGHKLIWLTISTTKEDDPYSHRSLLGGQGRLNWVDVADSRTVPKTAPIGHLAPNDFFTGIDALVSGDLFGAGFSWAPDERSVALSKNEGVWIYSTDPDRKDTEPRRIFSGGAAQVTWSSAGSSLYVLSYGDSTQHLLTIDLSTGQAHRATDDERWHGEASFTSQRDSFALSLQDIAQPTGIYVGHEGSTRLTEVMGYRDLNPAWQSITPLTYRRVHWRSRNKKYSLDGILISSTKPVTKHPPLLVTLFGAGMSTNLRFGLLDSQQPILVAASQGNTVFIPNSRGRGQLGGGYDGLATLRTYFSLPSQDVEDGINTVVAEGLADRKHIALMGVSFGGGEGGYYIAHHPDIRAAALLEPVSMDLGAMWRETWAQKNWGGSTWGKRYHIANPYDGEGKAFLEHESPLTYVNRVRTPTLLEFGAGSGTALAGGNAFFQALQWNHVDSALIIDPRTLHGISERSLLIASFRNRLDWIACHVSDDATENQRQHCAALSRAAPP